jgi:hypothetical protein
MRRQPKTPLARAVYTLQTGNIPYRLDTDDVTGVYLLFINGASLPQVYNRDGIPVPHQPGKAR